jgi:hypothetical protein
VISKNALCPNHFWKFNENKEALLHMLSFVMKNWIWIHREQTLRGNLKGLSLVARNSDTEDRSSLKDKIRLLAVWQISGLWKFEKSWASHIFIQMILAFKLFFLFTIWISNQNLHSIS